MKSDNSIIVLVAIAVFSILYLTRESSSATPPVSSVSPSQDTPVRPSGVNGIAMNYSFQ